MSGTFTARISELRRTVGSERVTAHVVIDQVYAHYQHERMDLRHPRGGRAKYLEGPLLAHHRDYLRDCARTVLRQGLVPSMKRSAEHLSDQVELSAPREWGDLMHSGHPIVTRGGVTVFDRPPKAARLGKAELSAKSRAIMRIRLAAGRTVYFMRNGKVMVIPGRNEPHGLRGRL